MPHPKNQARVTTQANGLFGAGLGQGQRLFAKDMLSGRDRSLDLGAMQRMRRRQHDGFNVRVGQRIRVIGRQRDPLLSAKGARRLEVRLDRAHNADVRRRALQAR